MGAPLNIQGRKYGPVGRCIYCGSDGGADGLGDEHIIPFALGGRAILQDASCRACEAETSYLDGYLARNSYYDLRVHNNIQSRRPKERPKKLPTIISIEGEDRRFEADIADHPHFVHLPVWGPPGLMQRLSPSPHFSESRHVSFHAIEPIKIQRITGEKEGIVEVKSEVKINEATFARAIAKIAYCNVVAHFGFGSFWPVLLTDVILGKNPNVAFLVGSQFEKIRPSASAQHRVEYGIYRDKNFALVYSTVWLFASSGTRDQGMPIYEVILGIPRDDLIPYLEGGAPRPDYPDQSK
ncbi:MAG: hypothetical protein KF835_14200 [Xanthobacteraceae bacterium]|nr:hypothetical protein [Xanthobacteraceae bacterium]